MINLLRKALPAVSMISVSLAPNLLSGQASASDLHTNNPTAPISNYTTNDYFYPRSLSLKRPTPHLTGYATQLSEPTEANLDVAYIKCSSDADVTVNENDRVVEIADGALFALAKQPLTIKASGVVVRLGKGVMTHVSLNDGVLTVRNLSDYHQHSVETIIKGVSFRIRVGQEIMLAHSLDKIQKSGQADSIQRRCPTVYQFGNQAQLLACEFSPITLLKTDPLMQSIRHSKQSMEQEISKRLLKTTACLAIATASHGLYRPVYSN